MNGYQHGAVRGGWNHTNALYVITGGVCLLLTLCGVGARCSSVVRAFAHGAMGRWIDPSWWTWSEM